MLTCSRNSPRAIICSKTSRDVKTNRQTRCPGCQQYEAVAGVGYRQIQTVEQFIGCIHDRRLARSEHLRDGEHNAHPKFPVFDTSILGVWIFSTQQIRGRIVGNSDIAPQRLSQLKGLGACKMGLSESSKPKFPKNGM